MGWMTKKSYGWEMKRMVWPILSIMAFIPMPIHLFPIAMIDQGYRAKVRSWVGLGVFFFIAEFVVLALFVLKFKHFDLSLFFASVATFVCYLAFYLIGNIVLISQTKSYLKRLELKEVLGLEWVTRPNSIVEWKPTEINTPQTFIAQLLSYRNEINSVLVKRNIDTIIGYFRVMIDKNQQKAELLTIRHQAILSMLFQYKSIQTSNIKNTVMLNSKTEIEKTLDQAVVAMENEVTNQYESESLEASAEKEVYIQQLRNRDLLK